MKNKKKALLIYVMSLVVASLLLMVNFLFLRRAANQEIGVVTDYEKWVADGRPSNASVTYLIQDRKMEGKILLGIAEQTNACAIICAILGASNAMIAFKLFQLKRHLND